VSTVGYSQPSDRATDIPSWEKNMPNNRTFKAENGRAFAERLMNDRYGKGNWDMKNPKRRTEFSELQKYGNRGFQ